MSFATWRIRRSLATVVAVVVIFGIAGCASGRYPVVGRVTYEDGTPLTEGNVIGYMSDGGTTVMVQGTVQRDGSFTWGSEKPGDGAKPGKYRVAVIPRTPGDAERAAGVLPAVDGKYSDPDKSGIEVEVRPQKNEVTITVTKPNNGRRR